MNNEHISTKRLSLVVLLVATLIVAVSLQGLAFGQTLEPGKAMLMPGPGATEEDKITSSEAGPPERVSILVHMTSDADRMPMKGFVNSQGAVVKYTYKNVLPNVINVRNFPTSALNGLLAIPGVKRVEEDRIVHMHLNDSTPLIRGLQSQIVGAGLSANGSGVRVCVLDTGIDSDHAMYSGRIDTAAGYDFVNNDSDPEDDNGHGSHVAGIAVGGNGLEVDFGCVGREPFRGVAPEATLVGIKVLGNNGSGSASDIIAGINYGADPSLPNGPCDVMNLSLGGGLFTGTCETTDSMAAAANNAADSGVVVVASSGNDHADNAMGTPACGSKVISVGATYDDDYPSCEFPDYNSFTFCTLYRGPFCRGESCTDNSPSVDQIGCYSNESDELDVTAPGCLTYSAYSGGSSLSIITKCGTSMAAPHAAGLAALLLDADPSLTPTLVRQYIRDGAIDLGASGFDRTYGHGRIDVINSLSIVGDPQPECTGDGDCDEGDLCTDYACVDGACQSTPKSCDDGDACTTDSCDQATGECLNITDTCDDGDACTNDSCDTASGCINDPITCPDDGNACTTDGCDPATGQCLNDPISCDDGDACTNDSCDTASGCINDPITCPTGETCIDGDCVPQPPPCGAKNTTCTTDSDCCSNKCRAGKCRGE